MGFEYLFFFFFQAEDGIRDVRTWLEFRRVLFRSVIETYRSASVCFYYRSVTFWDASGLDLNRTTLDQWKRLYKAHQLLRWNTLGLSQWKWGLTSHFHYDQIFLSTPQSLLFVTRLIFYKKSESPQLSLFTDPWSLCLCFPLMAGLNVFAYQLHDCRPVTCDLSTCDPLTCDKLSIIALYHSVSSRLGPVKTSVSQESKGDESH